MDEICGELMVEVDEGAAAGKKNMRASRALSRSKTGLDIGETEAVVTGSGSRP